MQLADTCWPNSAPGLLEHLFWNNPILWQCWRSRLSTMTGNHHRLQHMRGRSRATMTWVQSLIRNYLMLILCWVSTGSQNDYEFVRECTLRSYRFVEELNISTQIHCEQLNSRNLYKKHTWPPHPHIYTNILISGARNCLNIFNQSFILDDIRIKCESVSHS